MTTARQRFPFLRTLYFRVLVGIVTGVLVGILWPQAGASLKPLGDGFLKLIRMLVAPIVFFTVVSGIASAGDLRRLGRVGLKALAYFEVVSTFALLLGLIVAELVRPGAGFNASPASLNPASVSQYTAGAAHLGAAGFLLNIIPESYLGAFTQGEILQVLLLAILTGVALLLLDGERRLVELNGSMSHLFFKLVAIVMEAAPVGAFGAMAFTIGRYGMHSLLVLGRLLLCVYLTSIGFVALLLGVICWACGVSLWRLLVYLREELLIVLGTSSSEPVLPRLMLKLEALGCSKAIVGLVVPAGYSFNLDGTSIYLTVATVFLAQATNTHLSFGQLAFILFVLMLNSKGAATVTGGGLITLAATLAAVGTIPVASIALLLGVDRFMSECRALVNVIGNAVASIVISRWEGRFDLESARLVLAHPPTAAQDAAMLRNNDGVV